MSVFNLHQGVVAGAAAGGGAAFDTTLIGNSVWLDGTADYFSRTYAGSGNSTTEGIFSFWYQRYSFGVAQQQWFEASGFGGLQTNTSYGGGDTILVNSFTAGGAQLIARHTRLLRDTSWYHIIVSIDMSQATTLDKIKFYINGEQDTTINVQNLATTNGLDMLGARSKVNFRIGENPGSTGHAFAQYCYLDGVSIQQGDYAVSDFLDTFTFGTNGSQYVPKADADIAALATTVGGNSFCLDFSSASVALSSGVTPTSNAGTFSGSLSNLTDGNFTTDWRSTVDPATSVSNDYVAFDLGSAKDVKAVKITGRASTTGNYKVQFSDNGSDFTDTGTTFSNVSITTTANSGILDLTSDNPGSHRYWKLINISNSSGTSAWGFRQIILDSAVGNLGTDSSGNGNDFTPTSISSANQSSSTPSLNYAVLNILDKGSSATTSEGATRQPTGTDHVIFSSMLIPATGKWAISGRVDVGDFSFGICTPAHTRTSKVGRTNDSWGAIDSPGASFFRSEHDSVATNSTVISSPNDTFIIAFDADSGKLWLGRNDGGAGIAYLGGGDPTTGATPTYTLSASEMSPGLHFAVGSRLTVSFGQRTHFETLPTDFLELNSENLTAPDYQGIDYFNATLYTGNGTAIGSGGKAVTGVGFQPDFTWIKNRDAADSHILTDVVRGVTKYMSSDSADAEVTNVESLSTFDTDGFTVGNLAAVNTNTEDYVSWNWKMRGAGVANSDGTISSTVSASSTGAWSLITWTGTGANGTIGHGLSGAPELVIVKNTNDNRAWRVLETVVNGGTHYLTLNTTAASTAGSTFWNNSNPTASVINLGSDTDTNDLGDTMLAISFRSVPGVCKVGSYIGNGNADGPYVDCGFTPAFTIIKNISSAQSWEINDSGRDTYNPVSAILAADSFGTESTLAVLDYVSTGFKIRTGASVGYNGSGNTLIFLAIADIGGNGTLPPVYGR